MHFSATTFVNDFFKKNIIFIKDKIVNSFFFNHLNNTFNYNNNIWE